MSFTPRAVNVKYVTGRRVMLAGVALFALTHMLGYLPTSQPRNLPIHWTKITTFIPVWFWVTAWSLTLGLAVWEAFSGKGRRAIATLAALCYVCSAAYLASYILTVCSLGWGSREWFYVGLYGGAGLIVTGLLSKVGSLTREAPTDEQ